MAPTGCSKGPRGALRVFEQLARFVRSLGTYQCVNRLPEVALSQLVLQCGGYRERQWHEPVNIVVHGFHAGIDFEPFCIRFFVRPLDPQQYLQAIRDLFRFGGIKIQNARAALDDAGEVSFALLSGVFYVDQLIVKRA